MDISMLQQIVEGIQNHQNGQDERLDNLLQEVDNLKREISAKDFEIPQLKEQVRSLRNYNRW